MKNKKDKYRNILVLVLSSLMILFGLLLFKMCGVSFDELKPWFLLGPIIVVLVMYLLYTTKGLIVKSIIVEYVFWFFTIFFTGYVFDVFKCVDKDTNEFFLKLAISSIMTPIMALWFYLGRFVIQPDYKNNGEYNSMGGAENNNEKRQN